jgi:hypothetical protein
MKIITVLVEISTGFTVIESVVEEWVVALVSTICIGLPLPALP